MKPHERRKILQDLRKEVEGIFSRCVYYSPLIDTVVTHGAIQEIIELINEREEKLKKQVIELNLQIRKLRGW